MLSDFVISKKRGELIKTIKTHLLYIVFFLCFPLKTVRILGFKHGFFFSSFFQ